MTIYKFLSPRSYINAIKFRCKKFRRQRNILHFVGAGASSKDKQIAYQMFLSMERPFDERPKEVLDYITQNGTSTITLRHKYFENTAIEYDLSDNFQMAICHEFFIENVYDLNKVSFEPSLVIDCGAYKGYFTWLALAKYNKAKFICIEAHPANYSDILKTAGENEFNNVEIIHAAVSTSNKPVEFFFEGSSGSMDNTFSSKGSMIPVRPIDLSPLIAGYDNVVLKIDIEGAELDFFPRIIKSLPKKCAVFFETHDGWNTLGKIRDEFSGNGFSFELIREREQFIDSFAQRS